MLRTYLLLSSGAKGTFRSGYEAFIICCCKLRDSSLSDSSLMSHSSGIGMLESIAKTCERVSLDVVIFVSEMQDYNFEKF